MKLIAFKIIATLALIHMLFACASGGVGEPVTGNERGSAPINDQEVLEYKRAVNKCYKTGGTRVVKVAGKLRCYD